MSRDAAIQVAVVGGLAFGVYWLYKKQRKEQAKQEWEDIEDVKQLKIDPLDVHEAMGPPYASPRGIDFVLRNDNTLKSMVRPHLLDIDSNQPSSSVLYQVQMATKKAFDNVPAKTAFNMNQKGNIWQGRITEKSHIVDL